MKKMIRLSLAVIISIFIYGLAFAQTAPQAPGVKPVTGLRIVDQGSGQPAQPAENQIEITPDGRKIVRGKLPPQTPETAPVKSGAEKKPAN